MRPSLFGSGCRCIPAPSCSESAAYTDVRLRQSGLPAEARPQRPAIQRYSSLDSQLYDFDTRRCRVVDATSHSLTHYAIDHTRRRRGGHNAPSIAGRTRTPTSRRSGRASTTRSRRSRRRARRWTWAPRRWSASTGSSPPPSLRRWPTRARVSVVANRQVSASLRVN